MSENKQAPEGVIKITEDMMEPVDELEESLIDAGLKKVQEAKPAETTIEKSLEAPDTAEEAIAEILDDAAIAKKASEAAEEAVAEAQEEIEKIAA